MFVASLELEQRNTHKMLGYSAKTLKTVIPTIWDAGDSAMIWGEPGIGKSDAVRQIAAETTYQIPLSENGKALAAASVVLAALYGQEFTGRRIYDVRLLLCNPTDIKGIPVFDTRVGRAKWVMTGMLPDSPEQLAEEEEKLLRFYAEQTDENTSTERKHELSGLIAETTKVVIKAAHDQFAIVFLDEISVAPKMVQGAALQLVLDRSVGTWNLSPTASIVAAGNRSSDRSGATAMSPPLASRFAHLNACAPTLDEWIEWGTKVDMPSQIIGYLKFKPTSLHKYEPDQMTGSADSPSTFPCPRTWAKLGNLFNKSKALSLEDTVLTDLIGGYIGGGTAAEFMGWMKVFNRLPDPQLILDGQLKTVDFKKLSKEGNPNMSSMDAETHALSLRFAFFYSLASTYMKHLTRYVEQGDAIKAAGGDAKKTKENKDHFDKMSINFFKFVNADEEDIEYGMVIVNNFILKERQALRVLGELRSLPDPDAKANLDRIIKVLDNYRLN